MRRRNPDLELTELWSRLKKRGYTRRLESLYQVMKKLGLLPSKPEKQKRIVKPYEQMTHAGERVQVDVKVVPRKCIADPEMKLYQYTAIDEYTRLRFLYGYEEQSTYSSADFAERAVKWFKRRGITVECIQTDNGFEFTNRFSPSKKDKKTLFENRLAQLGVKHKLIRPYTPRHNGKVERSHREDHNKFYSCHSFYSCADLNAQLAVRLNRTNNRPMRPLNWLSPIQFFNRSCPI
jgi:transposase InsO family protein